MRLTVDDLEQKAERRNKNLVEPRNNTAHTKVSSSPQQQQREREQGCHCWDFTQNFRLSDFLPPTDANAIGVQQHYYCSDGTWCASLVHHRHGRFSSLSSLLSLAFAVCLLFSLPCLGTRGNLGNKRNSCSPVLSCLGTVLGNFGNRYCEHWGNSCCSNEKELFFSGPSLFWEL